MFASLFKSLNEEGVEFLVLGGAAVCLSGFARFTEDIDILIKNTPGNVERLVAVVTKWGEGTGAGLTFEDFQGAGALRIVEDFPLDVFTLLDGRNYESFAANAVKYTLDDGLVIPSLSIRDLIEVKAGTMRDRDVLDVTVLRRLQAGSPSDPPQIRLDPILPTEKVEEAHRSALEQKPDDKNKVI